MFCEQCGATKTLKEHDILKATGYSEAMKERGI